MNPRFIRSAWLALLTLACPGGMSAQAPALEKESGRTVVDTIGGDGAAYSIRAYFVSLGLRATAPS